ncbi:MAG: UvrD-helicase domain-containing protein [Spirochaetaceae bacterium]|jgi:ATP-dependent helicase/nuclease subunit A|nr:UvrD-helicase domain-containing protein [Spirochaetaceae bacterium]
MSVEKILGGLNAEQLEAVTALSNVVVTAGAGSGKTKVLASRFAYLVIEKGCKVDEILTLTFTNKATNEMYSRIYKLLSGEKNAAARNAVQDFHKAKIQTLDSFCAEICVLASARYGIKNDFVTDAAMVSGMAKEAALSFVLDNREAPGIKALIADNKILDISHNLFAEIVIRYGSITNPLPFDDYIEKQQAELSEKWRFYSTDLEAMIALIRDELPGVKNVKTATYQRFYALFNSELNLACPAVETLFSTDDSVGAAETKRLAFCSFIKEISKINSLRKVGNAGGMELIREVHDNFKDMVYPQMIKIAAMILQFDTIRDIFLLINKFQEDFNKQKRISGMMTFNDVAELALTILKNESDIRNIYKEKIKAIMIDEFQDNNELQRELLFLLGNENIFFVGDQKQSIYRFRGADVSVFKKLSGAIEKNIRLKINYRSCRQLIQTFNSIFSEVFVEKNDAMPDFEAEYEPLSAPEAIDAAVLAGAAQTERAYICLFDKNTLSDDAECGAEDVEAAFVAEKIRRMVDGAYQIRDKENGVNRACTYSDFAVLERSVSLQHNLEKQFRAFGVPYNSENCAALFIDAPANDICNFLRLLVYPKDKSAYAAVLRSPFARLSDITLTICMLKFSGAPFDAVVEDYLPESERALYRRAGNIYHKLSRGIREQNLSCAGLITKLWYDYAYRYDTLWSREAQVYNEIYDYLFELARINDTRGKTLADFIDYLDTIALKKERLQDFDLPLERRHGVKILTIHKSKGLEFPIVFIYGCGAHGQNVKNSGIAAYSHEWGVSLNLNPPENFPAAVDGNYFFELMRNTEKQKEEAELRRLLYVAMTRAEDTLVLTGVKNSKNTGVKSFLDLLEPVLGLESVLSKEGIFSFEDIAARTRTEIRAAAASYSMVRRGGMNSMLEKAEAAAEQYSITPETVKPEVFITRKQASRLHDYLSEKSMPTDAGDVSASDRIKDSNGFFENSGFTPAEFGVLVHRVIEERFNSGAFGSSNAGNDEAEKLVNRYASVFFDSDIGKKSLTSPFRKTEYAFLSLYEEAGKKTYISGVIDLLFEYENEMYIIDYKTDTVINPEKHYEQLDVYSRAVENLFSKKTRAYLFYLREGRLIEKLP